MNTSLTTWTTSETNHILFPTDFSRHSQYTWPYVLAFAKNLDATVHILHVIDTGFQWETQPYETDLQRRPGYSMEDEIENRIDILAKEAHTLGINAECHCRTGKIKDEIHRLVDVLDIDLIIMSTHARLKIDVMVLGSKYLETIRNAKVPVLAIKHPEHEFVLQSESDISINRILCPCDLTSFSQQSVPIAVELCRHFQAELVVVHCADTDDEKIVFDANADMLAASVNSYGRFDHLTKLHDDVPSRIITLKGNPKKELPRICKDENVDLVVMATQGRGRQIEIKKGSLTEWFIIDAPCPIITIRPELMAGVRVNE